MVVEASKPTAVADANRFSSMKKKNVGEFYLVSIYL